MVSKTEQRTENHELKDFEGEKKRCGGARKNKYL